MLLLPVGLMASAPAPVAVLDGISPAPSFAFGLRRLLSAYAGTALRVRRGSDNAEADIGFGANGLLDTAALLAFCGDAGWVSRWHDQAGGAPASQTNAALQPGIVAGGAVTLMGGAPGLAFAQGRMLTAGASLGGDVSLVVAGMRSSAASGFQVVDQAVCTKFGGGNAGLHFNLGNGYGPANDAGRARVDAGGAPAAGWLDGVKQANTNPFDAGTAAGQAAAFGFTIVGLAPNRPMTLGSDGAGNGLTGALGTVVAVPAVLPDSGMAALTTAFKRMLQP